MLTPLLLFGQYRGIGLNEMEINTMALEAVKLRILSDLTPLKIKVLKSRGNLKLTFLIVNVYLVIILLRARKFS